MVILTGLFLQLFGRIFGIHLYTQKRLKMKDLALMTSLGLAIAYSSYKFINIGGAFVLSAFLILYLSIKTKELILNIIIVLYCMVMAVLGDYLTEFFIASFIPNLYPLLSSYPLLLLLIVFVSVVLTIGFHLLTNAALDKWQIRDIIVRYRTLILCLFGVVVSIFYLNIYAEQKNEVTNEAIRTNALSFSSIVAIVFIFMLAMVVFERNRSKLEHERILNQQLKEYFSTLETNNQEIRKFRHDYLNLWVTMSAYLEAGDIQEMKSFFYEKITPLSHKMKSNDFQLTCLTKIKCLELVSLLSNKMMTAQSLEIFTLIEIPDTVTHFKMDTMKLCRVLGILLDNAIEATKELENPFLKISILEETDFQFIQIKNPFLIPMILNCRESMKETILRKGSIVE